MTEILLLIPHPMETGLRKDERGDFVAAHYLTDVRVYVGERPVFQARMSQAVSQDPLLSFRFKGGRAGERLRVDWTDSHGERRSDEARLPA